MREDGDRRFAKGIMLRVSALQARPGMVLAASVTHPRRPDFVLLRAGVELDHTCIERLREMRTPELWIRYPSLEFLSAYFSPHVHTCTMRVASHIAGAFDSVTAHADPRLEFNSYRRAVTDLIGHLTDEPRAGLFMRELIGGEQSTLRHATNVCVLSILMGLKLEFYLVRQRSRLSVASARDISGLGVGAMLHDVGMLRLAPEVVEKWERTQDTSDPRWREHVTIGYHMVQNDLDPVASGIVLHHHQRFEGGGFPSRLDASGQAVTPAGNDIHVFARIVAVADEFDRLRWLGEPPETGVQPSPASAPVRISRNDVPGASHAMSTVRALRIIRERAAAGKLDPVVSAALLSVVPPYAPGSLVTLTNGVRCVVSSWNPLNPCAPKVVPAEDLEHPERFGEGGGVPVINLAAETTLRVAEAEGFDVTNDNFYPATPTEFDLLAKARRSENRATELAPPAETASARAA